MYLLVGVFLTSLLVSVGASAWFTRRLEVLGDLLRLSPGLLSLVGAIGANIPNYVASLFAAASGQVGVGIGIIVGSNIYNIALILGVATFVSPGGHGIALSRKEAQDARLVGAPAFAMMVTTALAIGFFSWKVAPHSSQQATFIAGLALLALNLLTLGLFCLLSSHALRRGSEPSVPALSAAERVSRALVLRVLGEVVLTLCIALGGVIVMVQAGQAVASDVQLPPAILSLIVLAVATSLPNTVVAFTLARTGRAATSVEEIFSSNGVNSALGIAAPLLLWSGAQSDRYLVVLDGPLMVALTFVALLCVLKRRVSRPAGILLILVYVGWISAHLLL